LITKIYLGTAAQRRLSCSSCKGEPRRQIWQRNERQRNWEAQGCLVFIALPLIPLGRAKLLNFRPSKVQGKIIATRLTQKVRRRFAVIAERWRDLTPSCAVVRQAMVELLHDWGAFLDVSLYQEALIHFLGGASNVERQVNLHRNELELGGQRMLMHAAGMAFRITAFTDGQAQIESHLRRLFSLTRLKAIQWINLNHSKIEFTTIKRLSGE
jgi:hypothetical protein